MSGGGGGTSEYWPGFVDALTNVVIAMVFVIVVLAISLSFALQLLAQRMAVKVAQIEQQKSAAVSALAGAKAQLAAATAQAQRAADNGARSTAADAKAPIKVEIPVSGNEKGLAPSAVTLKPAASVIRLEYEPTALTLDKAAHDKLGASVGELRRELDRSPNSGIAIVAQGPELQFSENQRAAFLRVMAVRNLLLEQGVPAERITTRVDTKTPASKPQVTVQMEGH